MITSLLSKLGHMSDVPVARYAAARARTVLYRKQHVSSCFAVRVFHPDPPSNGRTAV